MYRDFSEASKQRLLQIVSEVEPNGFWEGIGDWFGDRWLDFESITGILNIRKYTDSVDDYQKKVIDKNNTTKNQIEKIFSDVKNQDVKYQSKFGGDNNLLLILDNFISELSHIVNPANGCFNSDSIHASLNPVLIKYKLAVQKANQEIVYNEINVGYYGGNQGAPFKASSKDIKKYREIIEKNFPDANLSDKELRKYLRKINSEGCGYVALINTIFVNYINDPEGFEKTFGYPMYTEDGQLNYNMLLVDIYSSMDNHDENGNFDEFMDYSPKKDGPKDSYNWRNDETGKGTTPVEREYYMEEFMKEHNVEVDVNPSVSVNSDNVEDLLSQGKQIIVAFHDGNLYNMDGTIKQEIDGGHAMTVTGVTSDGKLIVSSWGNMYYIDPDEVIEVEYNGKKHRTSMTFATVEYK